MYSEYEKRRHCCCFTGHRPEKLTRSETELKTSLETEILKAIKDGFILQKKQSQGLSFYY